MDNMALGVWKRVAASIGGEPDKLRAIAVAAVMFAGIVTWRFLEPNPFISIGLLYAVPVALLAARSGIIGGLVGTLVAIALIIVWAEWASVLEIPSTSHVIWAVVLLLITVVVSWQVRRRYAVEREASRWFELSHDMLVVANLQGDIKRVNDSWTDVLGYQSSELVGRNLTDLVHLDDLESVIGDGALRVTSSDAGDTVLIQNRYVAKNGEYHCLSWTSRVIGDTYFAAARDITAHKKLEMRLAALASEDPLTGIANRRAWDEMFNQAMEVAVRDHQPLTIVVLDLDGLKELNDSLGHDAGDRFIVGSVKGWQESMRRSDFIARLGGDEFGVLLPASDERDAIGLVERMMASMLMSEHFSAGIARWNGEESAGELTRRADRALYRAKNRQRGSWSVDSDASPIVVRSSLASRAGA